ncbi:MAG: 1,4-alpha-glucan branching enzyme [Kangiellaceae bacterium]|nr:1,4-alpha-glucan branching enzyme [Kangiellaceae bacterium]|tara:strand:+ start:1564 stop:3786 length:2223 start_codon:yes stop_codon:yes gene_type:complete
MSNISLSREDIDKLIGADHWSPRSILGFHEISDKDNKTVWVVRALETDAKQVFLFWDDQTEDDAVELEKIDDRGLFQITLEPREQLQPYQLKTVYADGNTHIKHDAYYFAPQLTDLDLFLFGEGEHHKIYYKLGAHITVQDGVKGTLFAVWAPSARRVSVVGDFNMWDGRKHPMENRGPSGIWELFIPEIGEGTIYKYEIQTQHSGTILKADPYGFQMEVRPATGTIVADINNYEWNDQEWIEKRASVDPLTQPINIYEVHPGSWKRIPEEGNRFQTYQEMADELIPYVKEMGYTHIEFMGLAEHPFDGSWGYQVVGYYAATSRFGSPQGLMYFIDRCHQEGIGIIMDWVPAHFPKDAHGLGWFDGSHLYEHADPRQGEHMDWGTKIFNYGRNEVRNFLVGNALFWMEYYHIDGIRVDAVASMLYLDYSRNEGEWIPNQYGGRENLEAIHFLKNLNEKIFEYHPGVLSIAEESTAFPGVSSPTYAGGLGFNFKWNMGWMNDTLRYIEKDPAYRKYDNNLITFSLVYAFTENFILPISHDEVVHGKRSLLDKMPGDLWQKRANYRIYLTFMCGHPGKKLLYMGNEFGQWQEWKESQSLDWDLLDYKDHKQLQVFCKEINHLYKDNPVLFTNDFDSSGFEWIDFHDHDNSVYSFLRKGKDESDGKPILFVFNFTPIPRDNYILGVPEAGTYKKVFDSDEEKYGGSGYNKQQDIVAENTESHGRPARVSIDIPPLGAIALQLS